MGLEVQMTWSWLRENASAIGLVVGVAGGVVGGVWFLAHDLATTRDVGTVSRDVKAVGQQIRSFREGVEGSIARLDDAAIRVEGSIERLNQNVTRVEGSFERLDVTVTRLQVAVSSLEATVSGLQRATDSLTTTTGDLKVAIPLLFACIVELNRSSTRDLAVLIRDSSGVAASLDRLPDPDLPESCRMVRDSR